MVSESNLSPVRSWSNALTLHGTSVRLLDEAPRVRISEIVWTDADVAHIARHGISPDEVAEVLVEGPVWRRGRRHSETGRMSLYALGQTQGGRHLFVVLSPLGRGRARCVTAMVMDATARRYYERHRAKGE